MNDQRFAVSLAVTFLAITFGGGFVLGAAMPAHALDTTAGQIVRLATLIFGTVGALSGGAQVLQMVRSGSADDVSVMFLLLLSSSFVAWLSYGITLNDWVMITVNSLGGSIMFTTVLVAIRIQRRAARAARLTIT